MGGTLHKISVRTLCMEYRRGKGEDLQTKKVKGGHPQSSMRS